MPVTGSDVIISIDQTMIGTATSLSYSVSRRKLPVHTFGSVDPKGIGRGVRLINGVLDNVILSGQSIERVLEEKMKEMGPVFIADKSDLVLYEQALANIFGEDFPFEKQEIQDNEGNLFAYKMPAAVYLDQLLPVNIIMLGASEKGKFVKMEINGAEFTSHRTTISMGQTTMVGRVEFIAHTTKSMYEPELVMPNE
jgi:hypothetical protein